MSDKIFVVTGAGSGIGREWARQLVKRQVKVAGVDINPEGLGETPSWRAWARAACWRSTWIFQTRQR